MVSNIPLRTSIIQLILLCRKVYQVVVVDDAALLYRHGSLLGRKFVTNALQIRKGLEWSQDSLKDFDNTTNLPEMK